MAGHDVIVRRTQELDPPIARDISECDRLEFGDVPIVKKYAWSRTDWTVYIESGQTVASCAKVVERQGTFDGKPVKIGGVNNVVTREKFRGQGLSSLVMRAVNRLILEDLGCDWGLLLCASELVPFYSNLGWRPTGAALYFDQPGGQVRWEAKTLVLGRENSALPADKIDLCGLPW